YFGLAALEASRVSIPTLLSRAAELETVLTTGFPGERRTAEFVDRLIAVRRQWQSSGMGAGGGGSTTSSLQRCSSRSTAAGLVSLIHIFGDPGDQWLRSEPRLPDPRRC